MTAGEAAVRARSKISNKLVYKPQRPPSLSLFSRKNENRNGEARSACAKNSLLKNLLDSAIAPTTNERQLILKALLKMSWRSLVVGAIAESSKFFSKEFLAHAERASPFRFSFLREKRERLGGRCGLYTSLFEILLRARTAASPAVIHAVSGRRP